MNESPQSTRRLSPAEMVDLSLKLGPHIGRCRFYGCQNESQGVALVYMAFQANLPLEHYMRTYHVINGEKLEMRADAMAKKFREAGGAYKTIRRDDQFAEAEFTYKGETQKHIASWAVIQEEPFTKGKGGVGVKDKYKTPWSRTQMLWSRMLSDGLRFIAPEIVAGYYTPEDFGEFDDDFREEAEDVAPRGTEQPASEPQQPTASAPLAESAPAAVASAPTETPAASAPTEKPIDREPRVPVDDATVAKIKALIEATGVPVASIQQRLKASGMSKLAEMTMGDAQQLLIHLQERKNIDEWLNLPLTSPGNSPGRES